MILLVALRPYILGTEAGIEKTKLISNIIMYLLGMIAGQALNNKK